jgi:hypothetical protein
VVTGISYSGKYMAAAYADAVVLDLPLQVSADYGKTWTASTVATGLSQASTSRLAVSLTGQYMALAGPASFVSVDFGATWALQTLDATGSTAATWVDISEDETTIVFSGCGSAGLGLATSTSSGQSWAFTSAPAGGFVMVALDASASTQLLTAYDGAVTVVYWSATGGSTWSQVDSVGSSAVGLSLSANAQIAAVGYVVGATVSYDGGATFLVVLESVQLSSFAASGTGRFFSALSQRTNTVYWSSSTGESWSTASLVTTNPRTTLAVSRNGNWNVAGSIGGSGALTVYTAESVLI